MVKDNLKRKKLTDLWHARLGHINNQALQKIVDSGMVHGIPKFQVLMDDSSCAGCAMGRDQFEVVRDQMGIEKVETVSAGEELNYSEDIYSGMHSGVELEYEEEMT